MENIKIITIGLFLPLILIFFSHLSYSQVAQSIGAPVNTLDFAEFAPTISADGKTMIFESDRGGKNSKWRLYITYQIKPGVWSEPKDLTVINDFVGPDDFLGGPCLSYDGSTLYFTSNRKGTIGGIDIWYSKRAGDIWSEPKNLGRTLNSPGYDGFPSVSADGKYIYFMRAAAGERNTTTGQRCCQIFVAERRGAFFINPKPLPYPVNTGCEGYPRIMADGKTLIFSSAREGGKGGYDLYESKYINGKWTNPEPLDFLNTDKDDQLIAVPASGDILYFASTKSNSKDDIYKVQLPKKFRPDEVVALEGTIKSQETNKAISATITVSNIRNKNKVIEVENDSLTGKYFVYLKEGQKYDLSISAKGHTFQSQVVDADSLKEFRQYKNDVKLKKLRENVSFTLNNIFFAFDSASLNKESELEMERVYDLLVKNPKMIVEISAHTDDKGSDEYNDRLSQARAESVVRFLVNKGISSDRLVAKGYGKKMPAFPNDSDENRAKNRRVEFKVIKL
jgi:outer membrane protein OmpA-like peptidoglycan-associated protein/Tol biopolymer transport system component